MDSRREDFRAPSQARSLGSSKSMSGYSVPELLERGRPPKGLGSSASAAQLRAKSSTPPVPPSTLDDALVFGYGNVRSSLALEPMLEPPRGPLALASSESYLKRIRSGRAVSVAAYRSASAEEDQKTKRARNANLAPLTTELFQTGPPGARELAAEGWSENSPLALYVRRIRGPSHILPVRKQVGVIGNVERIVGLSAMQPGEERREPEFCYLTQNGLICITPDGRSDFISISKHMREDYQYRILGTMKVFRLWRHWKIFRAWKSLTKWRLFKKTRKKIARKLIAHWPRFHQCVLDVAAAVEPVAGLQLVIVKPHAGFGLQDFVESQTKHELLMRNYIRDCLRTAVARIDRCIREERAARSQDDPESHVDPLPRLARLIRLCEYVVLEAMLLAALRSVDEFLSTARLDSAALFRVTVSLDARSQVTMEPEAHLLAEAVGQLLKNTLTQLRHQPRVIFHPPFHEMLHAAGISAKTITNPVSGMDIGAYLAGTASFREQVAAVRTIIEQSFDEATKAAAAYAELSLVHAAAQRWPATPADLRASVLARCGGDLANLVTVLHDDVRKFRKWSQDIARTRGVTVRGVLVLDSNAMKGALAPFPRAAIAQLEGLAAAIAAERTEELHARMDDALARLAVEPEELDSYVEQRAFCEGLPATISEVSNDTQVLSDVLALLAHSKGKSTLDRAVARHALLYERVAMVKKALAATVAKREPMLVFYKVALEQVVDAASLAVDVLRKELRGPPFSDWDSKPQDVLKLLETHRATAAQMRTRGSALLRQQHVMGVDEVALRPVDVLDAELALLRALWEAVDNWKRLEAIMYFEPIKELRGEEIGLKVTELGRVAAQLNEAMRVRSATGEEQPVAQALERAIAPQLRKLPVVRGLASGAMQRRHWERLERALFVEFAPDMTLTQLEARKLHDYAALVLELAAMAAAEQALAQQFQAIVDTWETRAFDVGPAGGLEAEPGKEEWLRVHNGEEVEAAIVAHAALLRAMQSSPHNALIRAQDLQREQLRLAGMLDVVRALLSVQGSVTYLRSFFSRADSKATLGPETRLFEAAARRWADVLAGVSRESLVARVGANRLMLPMLTECGDTLARVRDALEGSLQHKRALFPRFFALSNDDLLEVLASEPEKAVQAHLWKLFDGVRAFETVALPEETAGAGKRLEIVAVLGPLGERTPLVFPVPVKGALEAWLQHLERTLSLTVAEALPGAVDCACAGTRTSAHWPLAFPAQAVAAALRVAFARRVHSELAPVPVVAASRASPLPPGATPAPSVVTGKAAKSRKVSMNFDAPSAPDSPRSSIAPSAWGGPAADGAPTLWELERRMAAAESEFHTAVVSAATVATGAISAADNPSRGVPNALRILAPPRRPEAHRLEGAAASWGERIETWVAALRMVRAPVARCRLQQAVVLAAHLRDSFEELARERLERPEDPAFQARLRLYYDSDMRQLTARALNATLQCTYEFKGTMGGLEGGAVMTPAAERCMASVVCALQHGPAAGGLLFGPAGAGRSETLRELAYILGRRLISVSCAANAGTGPEADAAAAHDLQHWVAGAVTTGAWLCVRGLERLGPSALSLLAEQLRAVHKALEERAGLVTIGRGLAALRLPVASTFAFFSASPAGLTHPELLTALPPTLISLLRPLHLQPPDTRTFASVMLQAAGFDSHQILAPKLARFYAVMSDAPADAADEEGVGGSALFGPRALRAVVRAAGHKLRSVLRASYKDALRSAALAACKGYPAGEAAGLEAWAVARALLARHAPHVGGLVAGTLRRTVEALFPALSFAEADEAAALPERLSEAEVLAAAEASGRAPMPEQAARVRQLDAALSAVAAAGSRPRAVLLLGEPGSGKTTTYRLVAQARELRAQQQQQQQQQQKREGGESAAPTQRPGRAGVSVHVFGIAGLDAPQRLPPGAPEKAGPGGLPASAVAPASGSGTPGANAERGAGEDGAPRAPVRSPQPMQTRRMASADDDNNGEGGVWPPVAFLEAVSRHASSAGPGTENWAVFDGSLDWFGAERLLPGLHDPLSGVRTLARDQTMPGRMMQVLIEAPDASGASPATLAACPTVYFPPSSAPDWRAALHQWLARLPKSIQGPAKDRLKTLGETLFPEALERSRSIAVAARLAPSLLEPLPGREAVSARVQDATLVRGALALLTALLSVEAGDVNLNLNFAAVGVLFAYCLVWGIAAPRGLAGSPDTRRAFDAWARNRFRDLCELPDARGTVFDYHINIAEQSLQPWTPASPPPLGANTPVAAPLAGGGVFVWHSDNVAAGYAMRVLMESGKGALLVGPSGSGKTAIAAQVLQRAPARLVVRLTPMARASAVESDLRARVARSRRLLPGRQISLLVDDLHLPAASAAAAGEPSRGFLAVDVFRSIVEARGLPDNRALTLQPMSDVQVMATASCHPLSGAPEVGEPSGEAGRLALRLWARAVRAMVPVRLHEPSEAALAAVFGAVIEATLAPFVPTGLFGAAAAGRNVGGGTVQAAALARTVLPRWSKNLGEASVSFYFRVRAALAKGEIPGLEKAERSRPRAADDALFGPRLRDLSAAFESLRLVRPDWIRDLNGNVDSAFTRLWATRLVAAMTDRLPTDSPLARAWVGETLIDRFEARMTDPPPKGLAEDLADPAGLAAFGSFDRAGEERDGSFKAMSAADVRASAERAIAEALGEERAKEAAAQPAAPKAAKMEAMVWSDGALRRLLALSRALQLPPRAGGHALLVAQGPGAGRCTLSRLAAHIAGFGFVEARGSGGRSAAAELRSTLSRALEKPGKPLVLYVPPETAADDAAMDLLHSIAQHGQMPIADPSAASDNTELVVEEQMAEAGKLQRAASRGASRPPGQPPTVASSRVGSRAASREGTPPDGTTPRPRPREGSRDSGSGPSADEEPALATAGRVHVVIALDCPHDGAWAEALCRVRRFPALAGAACPIVFGPSDATALSDKALASFSRAELDFADSAPASIAKLLANLHRTAVRFYESVGPESFSRMSLVGAAAASEAAFDDLLDAFVVTWRRAYAAGPARRALARRARAQLEAMDAVIAHFGAQVKRCDDVIKGIAKEERALEEIVARDKALVTRSRAIVEAKAKVVAAETEAQRKKDEEDAKRRGDAEAEARAAFNTHVRVLTRIEIAELDSTDAHPELVSALMHSICVIFDVPASLEAAWRILRSPSLLPDLDLAGFASVRLGERDKSEALMEALAPVKSVTVDEYDAVCKAGGALYRFVSALGRAAEALIIHKQLSQSRDAAVANLEESTGRLREMEAALAGMVEGLGHSRDRLEACAARLSDAEGKLADAQGLVRRAVQLKETLKLEASAGWLGEDAATPDGSSRGEDRGLALAARAAAAATYGAALAPPARRAMLAAMAEVLRRAGLPAETLPPDVCEAEAELLAGGGASRLATAAGVPATPHAAFLAAVARGGARVPLLFDPHRLAFDFVRLLHASGRPHVVHAAAAPRDLAVVVGAAAAAGEAVLVEGVAAEHWPPLAALLAPLLRPPAPDPPPKGDEEAPRPVVTLAGAQYTIKPGFRLYLSTCEEAMRLPGPLLTRTAAVDLGWGGPFPEAEAVARALLLDVIFAEHAPADGRALFVAARRLAEARTAAESAEMELLAAVAAAGGASIAEQAGLERAERFVADLATARASAAAAQNDFARLDVERQLFAPLASAVAATAAAAARFAESRPAAQPQLAPLRKALYAAGTSSPFRGLVAPVGGGGGRARQTSVAGQSGPSSARSSARSTQSGVPRKPRAAPQSYATMTGTDVSSPAASPRPRPGALNPPERDAASSASSSPASSPRSHADPADAPPPDRPDSPPRQQPDELAPPPAQEAPSRPASVHGLPALAINRPDDESGGSTPTTQEATPAEGQADAERAEAIGRHAEAVRSRFARSLLTLCGRALTRTPRAQLALALSLPAALAAEPLPEPLLALLASDELSAPPAPPPTLEEALARLAPGPRPAGLWALAPGSEAPAEAAEEEPALAPAPSAATSPDGKSADGEKDERFAWLTPAVLAGAAALAAADPAVFGRLPERLAKDPGGDWARWASGADPYSARPPMRIPPPPGPPSPEPADAGLAGSLAPAPSANSTRRRVSLASGAPAGRRPSLSAVTAREEGEGSAPLGPLRRMCLVRALCPDRLALAGLRLAEETLGPDVGDACFEELWKVVSDGAGPARPLLLLCPAGFDPRELVQRAAADVGHEGVLFVAAAPEGDGEGTLEAVEVAASFGRWIVLENAHAFAPDVAALLPRFLARLAATPAPEAPLGSSIAPDGVPGPALVQLLGPTASSPEPPAAAGPGPGTRGAVAAAMAAASSKSRDRLHAEFRLILTADARAPLPRWLLSSALRFCTDVVVPPAAVSGGGGKAAAVVAATKRRQSVVRRLSVSSTTSTATEDTAAAAAAAAAGGGGGEGPGVREDDLKRALRQGAEATFAYLLSRARRGAGLRGGGRLLPSDLSNLLRAVDPAAAAIAQSAPPHATAEWGAARGRAWLAAAVAVVLGPLLAEPSDARLLAALAARAALPPGQVPPRGTPHPPAAVLLFGSDDLELLLPAVSGPGRPRRASLAPADAAAASGGRRPSRGGGMSNAEAAAAAVAAVAAEQQRQAAWQLTGAARVVLRHPIAVEESLARGALELACEGPGAPAPPRAAAAARDALAAALGAREGAVPSPTAVLRTAAAALGPGAPVAALAPHAARFRAGLPQLLAVWGVCGPRPLQLQLHGAAHFGPAALWLQGEARAANRAAARCAAAAAGLAAFAAGESPSGPPELLWHAIRGTVPDAWRAEVARGCDGARDWSAAVERGRAALRTALAGRAPIPSGAALPFDALAYPGALLHAACERRAAGLHVALEETGVRARLAGGEADPADEPLTATGLRLSGAFLEPPGAVAPRAAVHAPLPPLLLAAGREAGGAPRTEARAPLAAYVRCAAGGAPALGLALDLPAAAGDFAWTSACLCLAPHP